MSLKHVWTDLELVAQFDSGVLIEKLQANGHLHIYFNEPVNAAKTTSGLEYIMDQYGDHSGSMVRGMNKIIEGPKILESALISSDHIGITQFRQGPDSFYPVDESGMWHEHVSIPLSQLYCLRNEFEQYKQKIKTSSKISNGKQAKREQVLNSVLTNAGADLHHQSSYERMGEPTRDDLWKILQGRDRQLFASGKDDFFKHQRLISFKKGSRTKKK
jgi:hypothetical protein|tara:strand:- start:472 stop:1119 length:648 start_codon:yes stop_codon:yes gene_type:complete